MGNVRRLQDGLKKLWTDELYSDQFKSSPSRYKHFDHALKHVLKAGVRLLEMTEEADHSGVAHFDKNAVQKYISDLLICSVRLANVSPTGIFDLEKAAFDRIERKMGVRLEQEANGDIEKIDGVKYTSTVEPTSQRPKGAPKRYTIWRLQNNASEWLGEADTLEEAEVKFEGHKATTKPGQILSIGKADTGRFVNIFLTHKDRSEDKK